VVGSPDFVVAALLALGLLGGWGVVSSLTEETLSVKVDALG
jgi:hypothetical protein